MWTKLKGYPGKICYLLGIWALPWMTLLDVKETSLVLVPLAPLALLAVLCRPFPLTAVPPKPLFPLPNIFPFLFLLLLICLLALGTGEHTIYGTTRPIWEQLSGWKSPPCFKFCNTASSWYFDVISDISEIFCDKAVSTYLYVRLAQR